MELCYAYCKKHKYFSLKIYNTIQTELPSISAACGTHAQIPKDCSYSLYTHTYLCIDWPAFEQA